MTVKNISNGVYVKDGFQSTHMATFTEGNVVVMLCECANAGNDANTRIRWLRSSFHGEMVDCPYDDIPSTNHSTCFNRGLAARMEYSISNEDTRRNMTNPLLFECYMQNTEFAYDSPDKAKFYIHADKKEGLCNRNLL